MLKLLEKFKDEAQFIIVTHQQQTMQVGDVLYGVTMEPGSGSRIFVKSKKQFEKLVSRSIE
jgi:chromosome segregation protein